MLRENLLKTYPKEVRLYFKDFPIDQIHPWARPAAIAGRCVFRQNPQAFWDYHDWIFDKQAEITPENLRAKVMEWAAAKEPRHRAVRPLLRQQEHRRRDQQVDRGSAAPARQFHAHASSSTAAPCPAPSRGPRSSRSSISKLTIRRRPAPAAKSVARSSSRPCPPRNKMRLHSAPPLSCLPSPSGPPRSAVISSASITRTPSTSWPPTR